MDIKEKILQAFRECNVYEILEVMFQAGYEVEEIVPQIKQWIKQ